MASKPSLSANSIACLAAAVAAGALTRRMTTSGRAYVPIGADTHARPRFGVRTVLQLARDGYLEQRDDGGGDYLPTEAARDVAAFAQARDAA